MVTLICECRRRSVRAAALRLVLSHIVLALCASGAHASDSSSRDAIRRVENGLLPNTTLKENIGVRVPIEQRMKDLRITGVSIAVIDQGKLAWARGYGEIESGGGKAISKDTLFQAGSISKPVAAMGALELVESGKLALEEDINAKLTSWKVPDNDFTKSEKVTLRRILSHRAGLTVHGFLGYEAGKPVPTILQILNGEAPANSPAVRVDTIPGTRYRYAGGGYAVMQLAVSDVTGKPFAERMRASVLRPLRMSRSTYEQPLPAALGKYAATGHYAGGQKVTGRYHTYPETSAAGLWTTPSDLAKYIMAVQEIAAGRSNGILKRATVDEMLRHQGEGSDYGLGLQVKGEGDTQRFFHGGADEGFTAFMLGYVHSGRGAVVMVNANAAYPLPGEIMESIAHAYGWPGFPGSQQVEVVAVPADILAAVVGRYELQPGRAARFFVRDGRLWAESSNSDQAEIFARPDGSFTAPRLGVQSMEFVRGDDGKVTKIVSRAGASVREFKKVE